MFSLIFIGINLVSLSITFFWSQLNLWEQCLAISLLSQSQFLADILCSSERAFIDCFTVTTVKCVNNIVFILCSYSIFRFTKEFTQSLFNVESWSYFMRSEYTPRSDYTSINFYRLDTLICLIILISHIAQLLLIRKCYCFCPGPHISFKYVPHNHLQCPMTGEISLKNQPN